MPKLDRFRLASARRLRAQMTEEERILWAHLWRIPVEGSHFRKQVPIGHYVADFASHRLKLVIEIDGAQHGFDDNLKRDAERDRWLESQGYRVLRFWNHEVKKELDSVLDTIYAAVRDRGAHLPLDGGGRREAAGGGDPRPTRHTPPRR
ncbi:MAG: endonuclease domain-containing protein [Rhizobiaceae bacterium]